MNRRDAALHLARRYPGGVEALALRIGKNADTLRKELTGVHGYKWGVDDEELMMELCRAAGVHDALAPLTAEAANLGVLLVPLPQQLSGDSDTFHCLARAASEFSEFMKTVADAVAHGKVTSNDLRRVERELGELVAQGQGCVAALRKIHEDAKPAHIRSVANA
jgi:hypothetical protein